MQPPLYSLTLIACAAIPFLHTDTCVWGCAFSSINTGRTANSSVQNSIICRHDTSICLVTGSYVVYSCAPPTVGTDLRADIAEILVPVSIPSVQLYLPPTTCCCSNSNFAAALRNGVNGDNCKRASSILYYSLMYGSCMRGQFLTAENSNPPSGRCRPQPDIRPYVGPDNWTSGPTLGPTTRRVQMEGSTCSTIGTYKVTQGCRGIKTWDMNSAAYC